MREYESYEIVKLNDQGEFEHNELNEVVDDPAFNDDGEAYPFQILGECESMANVPNWYEVITGFHTEDQAKRYVEALERADILKAWTDKSLDTTLETIRTEDTNA